MFKHTICYYIILSIVVFTERMRINHECANSGVLRNGGLAKKGPGCGGITR